jgi:hypothetical protein
MDMKKVVTFLEGINGKLQWLIESNASLLVEVKTS